jgi:hypothetical protein
MENKERERRMAACHFVSLSGMNRVAGKIFIERSRT